MPGATKEEPITSVCIVAQPNNSPKGFQTLRRTTHDKDTDADIWPDPIFGKRTRRYLCITRMKCMSEVVTDLKLLGDKDRMPDGFVALDATRDTHERSLHKKRLAMRLEQRGSVKRALCCVALTRRPALDGFVLVGELNGLSLCYQLGEVPNASDKQQTKILTIAPRTAFPIRSLDTRSPRNNRAALFSAPKYKTTFLTGVPFVINQTFIKHSENAQSSLQYFWRVRPEVLPKSAEEIDRDYDFEYGAEFAVLDRYKAITKNVQSTQDDSSKSSEMKVPASEFSSVAQSPN